MPSGSRIGRTLDKKKENGPKAVAIRLTGTFEARLQKYFNEHGTFINLSLQRCRAAGPEAAVGDNEKEEEKESTRVVTGINAAASAGFTGTQAAATDG